jgi:uncharacterized protein
MFKNKIIASALMISAFFTNNAKAGHLYRITNKNGAASSYIFGTIHMVPKDQLKLSPLTERVLLNSKTLFTEVDLNNTEQMKEAAPKMMMPEGQKLEDFMTNEQIAELQKKLETEYKVKSEEFNQMKGMMPIFWSKILMEKLMPELSQGFDFLVTKKAKDNKMDIVGLSTMNEEMESINEIDIKIQIEYFLKSIAHKEEMKKELDQLFKAYQAGDDKMLYTLIEKGMKEMPGAKESLLADRNKKWAEKLERTFQRGDCFVAVGAAHLIGEESLLKILESKGYIIEKVQDHDDPAIERRR